MLVLWQKGHIESECWKKRADSERTGSRNGSGHTDKGNWQHSQNAEGSGRAGEGSVFVTRHEANSMKQTTPRSDEVWYVDSGASNHMTSHEWFSYMERNRSRNKLDLIKSNVWGPVP